MMGPSRTPQAGGLNRLPRGRSPFPNRSDSISFFYNQTYYSAFDEFAQNFLDLTAPAVMQLSYLPAKVC
jgi:hypothetical protein